MAWQSGICAFCGVPGIKWSCRWSQRRRGNLSCWQSWLIHHLPLIRGASASGVRRCPHDLFVLEKNELSWTRTSGPSIAACAHFFVHIMIRLPLSGCRKKYRRGKSAPCTTRHASCTGGLRHCAGVRRSFFRAARPAIHGNRISEGFSRVLSAWLA